MSPGVKKCNNYWYRFFVDNNNYYKCRHSNTHTALGVCGSVRCETPGRC